MAEESKNDKYMMCSKCRSKYINDEEHISKDFGYTRLEEIYKTCVRCREKQKVNRKTYYESSKKCREEHKEERREYDQIYGTIRIMCGRCGSEVNKAQSAKHNRTNKCKTKPHPNDIYIVVDGRTYLKGKSPVEGAWHDTHVPYDIHEVKKKETNQFNFILKKRKHVI